VDLEKFGAKYGNLRKSQTPRVIFSNFDRNFLQIGELNFLQNALINRGPRRLPTCRKLGILDNRVSINWGPNMAKSEFFKPPYLPQMGADSPHSKTIFIRVSRPITLMGQIDGLALPSGRNEKWTKVQNF